MKRDFDEHTPELMDVPQPASAELEKDLENLTSLNRHFGSHRLICRFLDTWLKPGGNYRILDLATGAGDIPRLMVRWARAHGVTVQIEALDANPGTVEIARRASGEYPEITWTCGDAREGVAGGGFDLVNCSLALHHFSETDAVRLLRNARRAANRWVLVSDLERHWATSVGVWLLTALIYREPMTRYDGRLSARRAFSYDEMAGLAESAGWESFGQARFLFCRQAIWLSEEDLGEVPVDTVPVQSTLPCPT
ncbi:MAG: methyltransferase domain-containing protein [Chthoniobacteraceae bacterium]